MMSNKEVKSWLYWAAIHNFEIQESFIYTPEEWRIIQNQRELNNIPGIERWISEGHLGIPEQVPDVE